MIAIRKHYAQIEDVLVHIGMPLLILLTRKAGVGTSYYLAAAIPDEEGELDFYLAVSVSKLNLRSYLRQYCDLRYLFAFAAQRKHFRIDDDITLGHKLELKEFTQPITENLLPSERFFSDSHTSKYGVEKLEGGTQTIGIDGEWQFREFGIFNQKYTDMYAFDAAVAITNSVLASSTAKERIKKAFMSKPFRGGSSYGGFFNDLIDEIPFAERPSLEGIEYHSPGYVDLRGKADLFDNLKSRVEFFVQDIEGIYAKHDEIRGYLSKSNLLLVSGKAPELTADTTLYLMKEVPKLFASMGFDFQAVMYLTDRKVLIVAKIGLALFRRLSSASSYFAQGRLAYR